MSSSLKNNPPVSKQAYKFCRLVSCSFSLDLENGYILLYMNTLLTVLWCNKSIVMSTDRFSNIFLSTTKQILKLIRLHKCLDKWRRFSHGQSATNSERGQTITPQGVNLIYNRLYWLGERLYNYYRVAPLFSRDLLGKFSVALVRFFHLLICPFYVFKTPIIIDIYIPP